MLTQVTSPGVFHDHQLLVLAREIAMDIFPIDEVLERFKISPDAWEGIQRNSRFVAYLEDATITWNTALNASERIKVKGLAAIEDWLPVAYAKLHDEKETLRDKIELFKVLQRVTGLGESNKQQLDPSDRVSITINMGADSKLKVEKAFTQVAEAFTIDHDPGDVL